MPFRRKTEAHDGEPGRLAMPRRRGAAIGPLLMILGAVGALLPLVGPYFDFVIGPDDAWNITEGRFWLSIVPGIATFLGGLMLTTTANRATATLGTQLALAGGIWFVIGPVTSMLWNDGTPQTGEPLGGTTQQTFEWLAFHYGLGAAITALSALALGRVTSRLARDTDLLTSDRDTRAPSGRFRRHREPAGAGYEEPATTPREPAMRHTADR